MEKKKMSFTDGTSGKESAANAGDPGVIALIFGSGRCPGVGNGSPLKNMTSYSSNLAWKIP